MSEKKLFLYEPTTAITDYIIFILGIIFGGLTISIQNSQFHQLWGASFISIGIGAFFGGTSHGFGPKMKGIYRMVLWRITIIFIGISGIFMAMSSSLFFITENGKYALFITAGVLLILYFLKIRKQDSFRSAVTFYMPLLGVTLVGFSMAFYFQNITGALFITIGLIVCITGSLTQLLKISLHEKFNHNDLFHVIQMLGMYLMYRGGMEITPF
jgi:hypothetical protein